MSRAFNFSAGPAALPEDVLQEAREELLEWQGEQASVMEVSHRGKAFIACAEQAEADLRELLAVPDDYRLLFLQGGATLHFAQIPMNLAAGGVADYVVTGSWGEKAVKEASRVCNANVVATSVDERYTRIPPRESWRLDPAAAYVHITPNETIHGVEFHEVPDVGGVPLVADMSSTLLSRPLDVSRFGLIYAGAQKNIGPSGLVVMVVSDALLGRCPDSLPQILNYAAHAREGSMLNTPPTFAWYLAGKVFKWLKAQGGLAAMAERNRAKAELLYGYVDGSGFYANPVDPACRSWMNVPFTLADPTLDEAFLKASKSAGLLALKGHRSVGGMRASIYNAMPIEGVQTLVEFMKEFARKYG
ncbi:MAG TPA: 3-phosphoserine/phosphohydroxythreonine transaminase [Xanthomonadaceae bacterium]|nr:3-phosphoserine/phosphohydroxythreonine transaminase [Xanthomonadaceae bacterium]